MIFIGGNGLVGRRVGLRHRLGIRLHIPKDSVDLRVGEVWKDIHRRPTVLVEEIVEIRISRSQHFGVVVDPVMQKGGVCDPGSDPFEGGSRDDFNGIVTLGAIGLKKVLTVLCADIAGQEQKRKGDNQQWNEPSCPCKIIHR